MQMIRMLLYRIKRVSITNELVYVVADILIKAIAFITLPLFLSVMSSADYGEFSLYQSYASTMSIFFALGISRGVVRYYVEKENEKKYLGTVIWLDIFLGAICTLIIFLEESIVGGLGVEKGKLVVICVATVCNCICNLLLEDLRARRKAWLYGACGLFISVVSTGLGWCVICNIDVEVGFGRYVSSIVPIVILAIISVVYIFGRDSVRFKKDVARYLLMYSIPLIPYALSTTIISEMSKWSFAKVGFSEVGIYSFALNLASVIYIIVLSLNRAYQPELFMALRDGKSSKKQLTKNLVLYFLMYYGFLIFLDIAIAILGSKEYKSATTIIPIITCGYGYFFLYSLIVNYFYYYKKNIVISIISIISALSIVVFNLVLIPMFGYTGAALATVISYVLMYYLGSIYLDKKLDIKVFSLKESILLQMAVVVPAILRVAIGYIS